MTEHARTPLVWGSEPPAFSIGYEKPLGAGGSGFSVLFNDAPDPEDVPDEDKPPEGISLVCLNCLLDEHPELGRGLDLAREYGVADLGDDGEWVVGELSAGSTAASASAVAESSLRRRRSRGRHGLGGALAGGTPCRGSFGGAPQKGALSNRRPHRGRKTGDTRTRIRAEGHLLASYSARCVGL